jgi:hypothetical protein
MPELFCFSLFSLNVALAGQIHRNLSSGLNKTPYLKSTRNRKMNSVESRFVKNLCPSVVNNSETYEQNI